MFIKCKKNIFNEATFTTAFMTNFSKCRFQANLCMNHDDVIKWKHFPHYWPFVQVIHPVPSELPTQRPVTWSFDVFFDLRLNKRLESTIVRLVIRDAIVPIIMSLCNVLSEYVSVTVSDFSRASNPCKLFCQNRRKNSRPTDDCCRHFTSSNVIFTHLRRSDEWNFEPW